MQSSERTVTDHDAEDTIADVTQSSDMTALIAGHSGILADLMDVRNFRLHNSVANRKFSFFKGH